MASSVRVSFVHPTTIDSVARCDNGIKASTTIPIELKYYFVAPRAKSLPRHVAIEGE